MCPDLDLAGWNLQTVVRIHSRGPTAGSPFGLEKEKKKKSSCVIRYQQQHTVQLVVAGVSSHDARKPSNFYLPTQQSQPGILRFISCSVVAAAADTANRTMWLRTVYKLH